MLGIDLSSIPAEPNVKFKGNRHVPRVKGQFNYSEKFSRRKTRWTGKKSWWKLLGSTPAYTPSVWRILDEPKNAFLQSSVAYDGGKEHTKAAFLPRIHSHFNPWCQFFLVTCFVSYNRRRTAPLPDRMPFTVTARYFVNTLPQTPIRCRYRSVRYAGACVIL